MKGPAIFLAQFLSDEAPFNTLENICSWAASLGYTGVQIPTWDKRVIDLDLAAESKDYCDELNGKVKECGLEISELSTHLQGQLVAVHPAYDIMFDVFAPESLHGKPKERTTWAIDQVKKAGIASKNLGLQAHATFSGALAWHTIYPWPQRPAGLIDMAFEELAKRWAPILNHFEDCGIDLCYEIHAGEDLHDGITFERFLDKVKQHPRANMLFDPSHFVLQQMDYLTMIDHYHERIKMFHVKDAEYNPNGKSGVYGGYQEWIDRPGRFRSPGDGQVDFTNIFSKLAQYNYEGWAVLEWECCIKSQEQGAREGAPFIEAHMIERTEKSFDDFASGKRNEKQLRDILGLE
jgi:sugar phosphate isomerase/epimerase